jgi:hypothetical protein
MQSLEAPLIFIHLLGMAAVVGGYFAGLTATPKRLSAGIVHGTLLQLVSGALLLGAVESAASSGGDPVNHAKFGVKILIVTVMIILAWPRRRAENVPTTIYHAIGLLAIANVAIAALWK